ncbi:MAG: chemotaxis protein CheX [Burkholderiales bacterium]
MTEQAKIVSKVLVLDSNAECFDSIKTFCDSNGLVGLKVQPDNVMAVLRSNLDLGAILLSETYTNSVQGGTGLARKIHAVRPELPIFLRREVSDNLDDMVDRDRLLFSAAYTIGTISKLQAVIEEFIFSRSYPNALVRGITEIAIPALVSQFKSMQVEVEAPYLVRDRLIFGEIFTLIPLESSWCRGYMMLQTEEDALMHQVKAGRTFVSPHEAYDFRSLNGLLGEITNLIWGAIKNRYLSNVREGAYLSQVPIIINNLHRYISFGSDNPQLCFKYTISDPNDPSFRPLVIQQKFVFNLDWSPEDFSENLPSVDELVSSGELEFF